MTQVKKFLMLVDLLKKQVITQKLLWQNVKCLVLLTGLATTSVLNAVENKTPKISVLV